MAAEEDKTKQTKRTDYINWQEYFMATAVLAAERSKDPHYQTGACIVDENNKIVGIGYNGLPIGCHDDKFPWAKGTPSKLDCRDYYVCHAEMNAVIHRNAANVKGCTIYVVLFPCNECAKVIIQSGITKIYYFSDEKYQKEEYIASKRMLDSAGVEYTQFIPERSIIGKNITINWDAMKGDRKLVP